MENKEANRNTVTDVITRNMFQALTLLKRTVVRLCAAQEDLDIPASHLQVLSLLDEMDSLTITEISERFDIAKPNITPLVDRMIAAGLVDRVRSSTDRRVVNVVILPAGRQKLRQIQATLNDSVAGWSSALNEEEMETLSKCLESMSSILSKL